MKGKNNAFILAINKVLIPNSFALFLGSDYSFIILISEEVTLNEQALQVRYIFFYFLLNYKFFLICVKLLKR